ncbi:MAG: type VI secretion system baseplate subunit TssG [Desulfobacteraceae bacterium]|nr:MAG: type VI secretion system baseplate subunit TssG [Desulfobacteraceae bacterium]
MATQKRQPGPSLRERLFEAFYAFSFFQAVRLLEVLQPHKKPLGKSLEPRDEVVRFTVKTDLSFPASDISNLQADESDGPPKMEVAFMGLVGPSGLLPHWYTELVQRRIWNKDFGLAAFLDLFHHRLISLFYLAWKKNRFEANYLPDARDRHSRYLLSLAGLGTPGLVERIGLPAESLVFYSGLLARGIPSAVQIEAVVEYFAGTRVRVAQFIERTLPISTDDLTHLGRANCELGVSTVCGTSVRECQTQFRIDLGPVGLLPFARFLPTGDLVQPIFSLITFMVGIEYEFEISVYLKRQEVPACVLGAKGPSAPRLGWTSWVKSPVFTHGEDPCVTFRTSSLRGPYREQKDPGRRAGGSR